ncbi:MAG: hypothetical protein ACREQI_15690, partial [Candidatus Binataceae bacterium]
MKKTTKRIVKKPAKPARPAKRAKPVKRAVPAKSARAAKPAKPATAAQPAASNRKRFLRRMREQLLETKTRLLGEIDLELRAEREANKDEGMDTYDLASEERDREINFILSDRERVK